MSLGLFLILNKAKRKLADGTFDLDSHTHKMALLTNAVTMTANFVGTSTNAQYSDITSEVTGTGYTAGGLVMNSVTWTDTSGLETWTSNSGVWSNAVLTAKYMVIYDNTATNKDILGYMDLDATTNGGVNPGVSSSGGSFAVGPNANGWWSLT